MLPEHWEIRGEHCNGKVVVLAYRGQGFVSIDYERRTWGLGDLVFPRQQQKNYFGRGWRDALRDDAMAALKGVIDG